MKILLISILLVLLVNIERTTALQCVQCTPCSGSETTATNCTIGTDTCMATSLNFPGFSSNQKACVISSMCSAQNFKLFNYGFSITCCTTDGCNSSSGLKPRVFAVWSSLSFFSLIFLASKSDFF